MEMGKIFLIATVAAFATVGIMETIKNFWKTQRTWLYALAMIPLAALCVWMQVALPPWAIGIVLAVGMSQLCYQTIVQAFKALVGRVASGGAVSDMGGCDDTRKEPGRLLCTFMEFVRRYDGTMVDYDGKYGPQCVDLYRQYCRDVLGIPHTGCVEGARDLWRGYGGSRVKEFFDMVSGTEPARCGDVAVWDGSASNRYGHVALVVCGWGDSLVVFEQDGFRKDGARIRLRPKTNLLGYLRRKPE